METLPTPILQCSTSLRLDNINFSKAKFEYTSLCFWACSLAIAGFGTVIFPRRGSKIVSYSAKTMMAIPKQISIAGPLLSGRTLADSKFRRLEFYPDGWADLNRLHVENSDLSFFRMHEGSLSHSILATSTFSSSNLNGGRREI